MYGWKVLRFYRKYEDIIAYTIGTPQFNNGAIEGINQKVKLIKFHMAIATFITSKSHFYYF
ncbi:MULTISPECIES: hypothetical protein [Staphylococcus]|uniref:hypothetical protein n=1 Tax=Staphylococcus TaxID=1279 RepID=UPI0012B7776A|nr:MULTISPECIES: hypothetical protein [Staphylococcus]QPA24007.1 hypothetical protein ISG40_10195 [Mammaliicoccus fleurettii]QPA34237.1 hypothetical protein ISG41_10195 [Mammaliicoccus fleurettii]UXR54693.1 hypothetical protein MUA46_10630 [Staphylococcus schleiferi]UXR57001.1 hypothetical protein MUA40_10375 [Staphylococcus schleiferi]UXR59285.1 hypothetical protein MUA91_10375 [Staphylococcus schleiferi]